MAVKLHVCSLKWVKFRGHPCWKIQQALDDKGVAYDLVTEPWQPRSKRTDVIEATGQSMLPAIEFPDGTWYREESRAMEHTIREDRLGEKGPL